MPKPPKRVQVGPCTFEVAYGVADVVTLTGGNDRGGCDHQALRIAIADDIAPEQQQVTLLHEVLHAVMDHTGMTKVCVDHHDELEEQIVTSLAPALLDTLRRTPKLVRYLLDV